jgi:hypothetical protein
VADERTSSRGENDGCEGVGVGVLEGVGRGTVHRHTLTQLLYSAHHSQGQHIPAQGAC